MNRSVLMKALINFTEIETNVHKLGLKLLYVKSYTAEDDLHSLLHVHPFMEIFYVVKGSGTFLFESKAVPITKGDLLMINSNLKHTETVDNENSLEYIVIGVEGMSIMPYPKNELVVDEDNPYELIIQLNFFKKNFLHKIDEIEKPIIALLQEQIDKKSNYLEFSQNLLEILVLNILRNSETGIVIKSDEKTNRELEYIKSFIDIHYSRDLNLDELSSMVFVNKYFLIREFKKIYGDTPMNYLKNKRIEVAKDLLKNTDHYIKEIASIVGFNSQSHFSRVFLQVSGYKPQEYRTLKTNR